MGEKRKRQHIPAGYAIVNTRGPRKYAVLQDLQNANGDYRTLAHDFRGQYEATMWLYRYLALANEHSEQGSDE